MSQRLLDDKRLLPPPLTNDPFSRMADVLRPAQAPRAALTHLEVSDEEAARFNLRHYIRGEHFQMIAPGRYAQLQVGRALMMSDTPMERWTALRAFRRLDGHVLIGGLGLGMLPLALAAKPSVASITIVEQSRDVIDLVVPQLLRASERLTRLLRLVCADVFTWRPPAGTRFDTMFFDIWPTVCSDNAAEMTRLRRRYRRYLTHADGWLGCAGRKRRCVTWPACLACARPRR
jgi:hypothetical protein